MTKPTYKASSRARFRTARSRAYQHPDKLGMHISNYQGTAQIPSKSNQRDCSTNRAGRRSWQVSETAFRVIRFSACLLWYAAVSAAIAYLVGLEVGKNGRSEKSLTPPERGSEHSRYLPVSNISPMHGLRSPMGMASINCRMTSNLRGDTLK